MVYFNFECFKNDKIYISAPAISNDLCRFICSTPKSLLSEK